MQQLQIDHLLESDHLIVYQQETCDERITMIHVLKYSNVKMFHYSLNFQSPKAFFAVSKKKNYRQDEIKV